jgi:hypothetical protein
MPRDPRETTPFEVVPTAVPGEVAGLLWVHEDFIKGDLSLSIGDTLRSVATSTFRVALSSAVQRKFDAYVFTNWAGKESGWVGLWFSRVFSSGEKTTAFRTTTGVRSGIYWPPVLQNISSTPFRAYDSNGGTYVADTIWDFDFSHDRYDGPTAVTVEYFASHVSHAITAPMTMQPKGGTFDYGAGTITIPECLHPALTFTFNTGTTSSRYPYQIITKTFLPTNVTGWPSSLVIDDDEEFSNGLYIRRKVTATKPY